jgi:integrase
MIYSNKDELKSYRPAQLKTGKNSRIEYYAYNPETSKLQRIQVRINHISGSMERKRYAYDLIKRLNDNLSAGWNPFINSEAKKTYKKLSDAISHFFTVAEKKLSDDVIRAETYKDYVSYLRNLQKWLNEKGYGDIYIYKLDKSILNSFLEHIYVERDRAAKTRNNYLNYFRVFAGFLTEHNYTKYKITDGIKPLKNSKKQRKIISDKDVNRLIDYLQKENKNYLLACEVLYYTFIRPKEMSHIQIRDINFTNKTIVVGEKYAKNRKTQVVTIPKPLFDSFIEMEIYKKNPDFYLFSKKFEVGKIRESEKQFRDYWLKTARILKFPKEYKFYSLKDNGITDLITATGDIQVVRDQARHSSIAITDIYSNKENQKANDSVFNSKLKFGK